VYVKFSGDFKSCFCWVWQLPQLAAFLLLLLLLLLRQLEVCLLGVATTSRYHVIMVTTSIASTSPPHKPDKLHGCRACMQPVHCVQYSKAVTIIMILDAVTTESAILT
jgi:hypothetical protein